MWASSLFQSLHPFNITEEVFNKGGGDFTHWIVCEPKFQLALFGHLYISGTTPAKLCACSHRIYFTNSLSPLEENKKVVNKI